MTATHTIPENTTGWDRVPHYSPDPDHPILFYGGAFSNFVGDAIHISSPVPWLREDQLYTRWYQTVEHFYQASKAMDLKQHEIIANERDTWQAKGLGNAIELRPDWEDPGVKVGCMMTGLRAKFKAPDMREFLLCTNDRFIAEDSPTDAIWGLRAEDGSFTGQNLLGIALMNLRAEIRDAG